MAPNEIQIERLIENLKNFDGMSPLGFEVCARSRGKDNPLSVQILPIQYLQRIRKHAARTAVYLQWLIDDRQFSDRDREYLTNLDNAVRYIPLDKGFPGPFEFWFDFEHQVDVFWTKPPRPGAALYRQYQTGKYMKFLYSKEWEVFSKAFWAYRNLSMLSSHFRQHFVSLDLVGAYVENPTWLRVMATGSASALVIFSLILGGAYLLQTLDAQECRRHFRGMIERQQHTLTEIIRGEGRVTAEQGVIIDKTTKLIIAGMAFCPPPISNFELRVRGPSETDFSIRMGHGNP
jgi:hypothetical protein